MTNDGSVKSKTIEDKPSQEAEISTLAIVTLITSVLIIPFLALSIYRVAVQSCLSEGLTYPLGLSSHAYAKLVKLCNVLPVVPVVSGIVALIRIGFSRKRLYGKAYAISGIILAIVSAAIYWASALILVFLDWPA
ncbi:MAG: hypothetical protein DRP65_08085 [Planctomycetota bacterium]|nr:MAG: hypothetical protein DRP65_08085 [Planctomycetota bacterium]